MTIAASKERSRCGVAIVCSGVMVAAATWVLISQTGRSLPLLAPPAVALLAGVVGLFSFRRAMRATSVAMMVLATALLGAIGFLTLAALPLTLMASSPQPSHELLNLAGRELGLGAWALVCALVTGTSGWRKES